MNTDPRSPRRHFNPEEKVLILREHLLEKVPVSTVCEKHGLQPTQFYLWQKVFFEKGAAAFARTTGEGAASAAERKVGMLEDKLRRKDQVVSEIMEEMVLLKKRPGGASL